MNVVGSVLLTSIPNPMCPGCDNYSADPEIFKTWFMSMQDCRVTILADELDESHFQQIIDWGADIKFELGEAEVVDMNLFFQRWILLYQWLVDSPAAEWVWLTDCSDVRMLNPPWSHMRPNTLYVGSENDVVSNKWIVDNHPSIRDLAKRSPKRTLMNAGLVGGDRTTVLQFLDRLIWRGQTASATDLTDMGAFNLTLAEDWDGYVETGYPVHTPFGAWVKKDRDAWFAHK